MNHRVPNGVDLRALENEGSLLHHLTAGRSPQTSWLVEAWQVCRSTELTQGFRPLRRLEHYLVLYAIYLYVFIMLA